MKQEIISIKNVIYFPQKEELVWSYKKGTQSLSCAF